MSPDVIRSMLLLMQVFSMESQNNVFFENWVINTYMYFWMSARRTRVSLRIVITYALDKQMWKPLDLLNDIHQTNFINILCV